MRRMKQNRLIMYFYIATFINAQDDSEYTTGTVETHCMGNLSLFVSNTNEDCCVMLDLYEGY